MKTMTVSAAALLNLRLSLVQPAAGEFIAALDQVRRADESLCHE